MRFIYLLFLLISVNGYTFQTNRILSVSLVNIENQRDCVINKLQNTFSSIQLTEENKHNYYKYKITGKSEYSLSFSKVNYRTNILLKGNKKDNEFSLIYNIISLCD